MNYIVTEVPTIGYALAATTKNIGNFCSVKSHSQEARDLAESINAGGKSLSAKGIVATVLGVGAVAALTFTPCPCSKVAAYGLYITLGGSAAAGGSAISGMASALSIPRWLNRRRFRTMMKDFAPETVDQEIAQSVYEPVARLQEQYQLEDLLQQYKEGKEERERISLSLKRMKRSLRKSGGEFCEGCAQSFEVMNERSIDLKKRGEETEKVVELAYNEMADALSPEKFHGPAQSLAQTVKDVLEYRAGRRWFIPSTLVATRQ